MIYYIMLHSNISYQTIFLNILSPYPVLSYPTWYYGVLSDISCEIMSCVMLSSLIGYMHTQTHLKTLFLGHEVSGTTISWSAGSQVEGHRV